MPAQKGSNKMKEVGDEFKNRFKKFTGPTEKNHDSTPDPRTLLELLALARARARPWPPGGGVSVAAGPHGGRGRVQRAGWAH